MKASHIKRGIAEKKFQHRGSIRFERCAAKIYDKRAILVNGLTAKTNFSYSKAALERMLIDEEDLIEYEILKDEEHDRI